MVCTIEIIEALKDYYKYDYNGFVETVNNLIDCVLNDNKELAYKLSEDIEDECLNNHRCPLCGHDLITDTYIEPHGEEMIETKCSECNYIIE